jgi:hypothetical protein
MERTRILQFVVNINAFANGRLNPEVAQAQAGDCGANSLFLLDVVDQDIARELSIMQTNCRLQFQQTGVLSEDAPTSITTLFTTYLFTNLEKKYEILSLNTLPFLEKIEQLEPGKGTVVLMSNQVGDVGHYVVFQRNRAGDLEMLDLQTNTILPQVDFLAYLNERGYTTFGIPTHNLKRLMGEAEESRKKTRAGRRKKTRVRRKRNRKN